MIAWRILCAAVLAAVLAGCASSGVQVTEEQTSKFVKGKTTRSEVIQSLGPPGSQTKVSDGTTLISYTYAEMKTHPMTFVPFVGAFAGGADAHTHTVQLRFDAKDRLQEMTTVDTANTTKMGAGSGSDTPPAQPQPQQKQQPRR